MAEHMKMVAQQPQELTVEERNLLLCCLQKCHRVATRQLARHISIGAKGREQATLHFELQTLAKIETELEERA